jgi:hypothetical protein
MCTGHRDGQGDTFADRFMEMYESLDSMQKTYLETVYVFFVVSLTVGATGGVVRILHYYNLYPFNRR